MEHGAADRAPALDLASRRSFKHWSRVQIRYTDQDTLGHVNNVAYASYLEHARCEMIYPMIWAGGHSRLETVIVKLGIDFRREMTYPGAADVGTAVVHIGTKSFRMLHGIFKEGSDTCSATAETIMVWFDLDRRVGVAAPPDIREKLAVYAADLTPPGACPR